MRLYKKEKLCSEIAIAQLFDRHDGLTHSALAFPLRAVWRENITRAVTCPRFLISIPKKRLHHAVDRVKMRRRVREAYRLNHADLLEANHPWDIAFVYVADSLTDYDKVEKAMKRLLQTILTTQGDPK